MFERAVDYPTAVASDDDAGIDAAIDWCCEHLADGDTLTVWTALKSNLEDCPQLEQLVNRHSNVAHLTGRGGGFIRGRGPVLMAWANMDDIGKLLRHGSRRIQALCVIPTYDEAIRPWVSAVAPTILGDGSAWERTAPALDPLVVEVLETLTAQVNHNNIISAGFEKDMVISRLLALHDAGIRIDGPAMQGWALAHGWSGENPARLAKYAQDIKAGKRPRHRPALRADYVDNLRHRAAERE